MPLQPAKNSFSWHKSFFQRQTQFPCNLLDELAGDARKNRSRGFGGSAQPPVRQADHGAGSTFNDPIFTIDENGFIGLAVACLLLGHDVGQQIERFDVAAAPALIGSVMA